jgi:hypothetical protein
MTKMRGRNLVIIFIASMAAATMPIRGAAAAITR